MKIQLLFFLVSLFVPFVCLVVIVNRFFVSLKPLKKPVFAFLISFALCLLFLGFSVEEKPGQMIESKGYRTTYYINGVQVWSSSYSVDNVVGRVTIIGEVLHFALFCLVILPINALSLVYAKVKAKEKDSLIGKAFAFYVWSTLAYFTLGILAIVQLSDQRGSATASTHSRLR